MTPVRINYLDFIVKQVYLRLIQYTNDCSEGLMGYHQMVILGDFTFRKSAIWKEIPFLFIQYLNHKAVLLIKNFWILFLRNVSV